MSNAWRLKPQYWATMFLSTVLLQLMSCTFRVGPSIGGPQPVPAPGVAASALLLDASPFPTGWQADPCEPHCDRAERSSEARRTFGIVDIPGHVNQTVLHYGSLNSAHAVFESYKGSDLSTSTPEARSPFVPFRIPDEIAYKSPFADEQYLGCGIDVIPACVAGRRYGQYFVRFFFVIDDGNGEGLKIGEVEPILRAMDEHYAELFDIALPTHKTQQQN
jgi:hypothetical protein